MKRVLLTCGLIVSSVFAFAEDRITVAYTGSTYAALYAENDIGGVARRATAIAKVRKEAPDALVLDAGDFSAGGPFDPQRSEDAVAVARTKASVSVFSSEGYDAFGLGENDGALLQKVGVTGFLASNVKDSRAKPSLVKKVAGKTIYVAALASDELKENGLAVKPALQAMAQVAVDAKKSNADYLVLLAGVSYETVEKIVAKYPEIDMVIMSKASYPFFEHKKIGKTVVVTPFFLGKSLGVVKLSGEAGTVKEYAYQPIALDASVVPDAAAAEKVPACFVDSDCPVKAGRKVSCDKGGSAPTCLYGQPEAPKGTVVTIADCKACDTSGVVLQMQKKFPGLEFSVLDKSSPDAIALIKKHHIKTLPAYFFTENLDLFPAFEEGRDYFEKSVDAYMIKPVYGGIFYFLDREEKQDRIDEFLDIFVADSAMQLESVRKKAVEKGYAFNLYLLVRQENKPQKDEADRALAVKALYPKFFVPYVQERMKVGGVGQNHEEVMKKLGIDSAKIQEFVKSDKIVAARAENSAFSAELHVGRSGVVLIDNVRVFAMTDGASGDAIDGYLK